MGTEKTGRLMRRTLAIVLAWLLVAAPAMAVCTGPTGDLYWGPITSFTGSGVECQETGNPAGTDIVVIPDSSNTRVDSDLTYTADGSALIVEYGGEFTIDVPTDGDGHALNIHVYDGQDTLPAALGQVAVYTEPGSTFTGQGGYATRYAETPALLATASHALGNRWTVGGSALCGVGTNDEAGYIGGNTGGSCASGNEEFNFTLVYTTARNNPDDGGDGDNYLDENVSVVETDFLAVFRTGMEASHAYAITIIDHAADTFNLVLDTRQQAYGYTNDHAGFPLADRAIIASSATSEDGYEPAPGDTCIESADDLLDGIGDGGYVGACIRGCDASGANCDDCSRRISASFDDEHCDGTASSENAAFHFERPLTRAYVEGFDFTIEPLCICRGDEFDILAPARIVCDDSRDDGECKIVFRGAVTLAGFEFGGVGYVLYDGATATLSDVHARGCGTDGEQCTQFLDMNDVRMRNSSVVGGPEAGDSGHFSFSGITGSTYVSNTRSRYYTDTTWKAAGPQMGQAAFFDISCERIGRAEGGTVGCFSMGAQWASARIYDLFTTDPVLGNGANILTATSDPLIVNGLGVFGLPGTVTGGGISHAPGGISVRLSNLWARQMNTGRTPTASNTVVGPYLTHCDVRDSVFDVGSNAGFGSFNPTHVVRDCIFADVSTNSTVFINANDQFGSVDVSGNIFANVTTSNAGDAFGVKVTTDNDPTSTVRITNNSWIWDEGTTTGFDHVFGSVDTDTDDTLEFWGNLVYGHVSVEVGGEIISMDFPADMIAFMSVRERTNNCVGYGAATGGGGATYEAVSSSGSYPVAPLIGDPPALVDSAVGRYVLRQSSRYDVVNCGAHVGTRAPGMQTGHARLFERMGIPEPERFMVDHGRRGR